MSHTVKIVVCRDTVRISPQSVDPTIKNFHWGDLVRGMFEAYDRGGTWPVLVDAEGYLTEGPGFNLFVVQEGALLTPDRGVLEGITRRTVLELAAEMGIPVVPEYSYHVSNPSVRVSHEHTSGFNHQAMRVTTVSVAAFDTSISMQLAAL